MKKTLYTLLSAAMLIALFAFNGCKDKITDPVVDKTIPDDVFPLTKGNRFVYSGYFTNADTMNATRIFSGRLTYDKGGAIIRTLQFVVNNDSVWF